MTEANSPLAQVQRHIAEAAEAASRRATDVTLLAVGKRQSPAAIRTLFEQGQRAFGENYLQEALPKQALLADIDIVWHFIGRIQRNKTRDIAAHFDWVHTVDRAEVAERLSAQRPPDRAPLNCLIEVNVSGEASKGGVSPEALPALVAIMKTLPGLRLRGLMCLPAPSPDLDAQRAAFRQLRLLRDQMGDPALSLLSMGTSSDFTAAILEGADIVRIGTALFGARA
ncbi:MAG: YggS family pyridoxal phosphate-dependent enzyme [Gammaproteobacteria bacterium]|nr:YggS family pyridoxal phosphate-dependent enzyme [Gammaproteobacteria bacterium]